MDVYKQAKGIVTKLVEAGHIAYFAGGWVRDHIMGHPSQDIDIATSAMPNEIMDLFPNTILVGLAFGVVIVPLAGHQFEVATFRKDLAYKDGRHPIGVEPSTPLQDANRRDFTINGMFFDPLEEIIYDYVHGREDIKHQIIRTIGDPHERFFEDRLRMLRAFRFAARFGFAIEPETQDAIREHAGKLFPSVAWERVWQEFNKMANYPRFDQALVDMHRLSLLEVIFPEIAGLHLNDLKHLVASFAHFPPNSSAMLHLMELFPNASLNQKIDIAKRLKAPNREIKLLEFFDSLTKVVLLEQAGQTISLQQWAHLYAHPNCSTVLNVIAARYTNEIRQQFLKTHEDRLRYLEPHVKRIEENKPLLSASFLMQQGIQPGKQMGLLLHQAEKIAIHENDHDVNEVFKKLKKLSIWNDV